MTDKSYSELWQEIPWRKLRQNLFRLQCRLWKAVRAEDRRRANNLQKLILNSRSARLLAIRQVTQLNAGKRTAGIDGIASLTFEQRWQLEELLREQVSTWRHKPLREIPIPKKDGSQRILKIPTIFDRAWQCLVKYSIEPAHEALFHPKSYGFRVGRSAHDCQKILYLNLSSNKRGIEKRILELDIEKCFDRISHNFLMSKVIAPQKVKQGLWRCLKMGINPEFPDQGTPQGGNLSPVLANIALDGIENIHHSIRYADDMVCILKPKDNADKILEEIKEFLAIRGLKIKQSKTRLVSSTDGFDFLGWHFKVQTNGKFKCYPSADNYKAFRQKVKNIVNSRNYGAKVKAIKLAPIVRGWRNYHRYCNLEGSRFSLFLMAKRAWKVFNKEKKLNRYQVTALIKKAFPSVPHGENKFNNVKGDYSPFNGNLIYWSKRKSLFYDGTTAQCLNKQNHTCGQCGLKFVDDEKVQLHHIDNNHDNWKPRNLMVVHESCHDYLHMSKSYG